MPWRETAAELDRARAETPVIVPTEAGKLFGLYTPPDPAAPAARHCVVLFTRPRSHRNRMWVEAARRLAARGFGAFRFDYHGTGDSEGESGFLDPNRPYEDDTHAVLAALRGRFGHEHFLLVGACFDARTALSAFARDAAFVDGLVFFAAPLMELDTLVKAHADQKDWKHLFRALGNRENWRSLGDPKRWRYMATVLGRVARGGGGGGSRNDTPLGDSFAEHFSSLVASGAKALFVYGDTDAEYASFQVAQQTVFTRLTPEQRARFEMEVWPGDVHGFLNVPLQRRALEHALGWLERFHPHAHAQANVNGSPDPEGTVGRMDFEITPEQQELSSAVRAFAREQLNHDLEKRDHEATFPRDCWQKCAEFGVLGLPVPSEFGGQGHDLVTTTIAMEALGWGCRDNGLVFSLNAQMWAVQMPLAHYGSDAQKREWLPRLVSGKAIGAHAITEPGAGSDVFSLASRAERKAGGYVLNGQKTFATNAPVADLALVFAYLQRDGQSPALTAFLVPRGTKGVTFGNPIAKMGLRTSPMGEVILEDCFVPESARLGPEGAGMKIFNSAMEWERACIFAGHLGAMERLMDDCIAYAKQRRQFGQPIAKFESVADRIADMKVAIEAGRWLLYRVGWLAGQGKSAVLEAAMAKLFVSEMHSKAALDALQLHGGYGYMKEYPIEREVRDALSGTLYSGTSEMQRKIIARCLGL